MNFELLIHEYLSLQAPKKGLIEQFRLIFQQTLPYKQLFKSKIKQNQHTHTYIKIRLS